MPLHAPPLSAHQIALLRRWVDEGARWEEHWAFVAPKTPSLPIVNKVQWPRQPIDRFVLARLEHEGLTPAPEADKASLLRRVSLDLTGLPPTPGEVAEFLGDSAPDAYERLVDRLLASRHYGERWASMWLDLARYADSRGYEKDWDRPAWPYRDWVIEAFNANIPYDQFVITQLAGDLLSNPTLEDRIATAFQRLTPANDENGSDDEEFRLVAVMDRVATTWSVLNGLTMACVQCHSHPYDPIRHNEYYKFLAFYNTSRDADISYDDSPTLPVPKEASYRDEVTQLENRRVQLSESIVEQGRSLARASRWAKLPIEEGVINEVSALEYWLGQLKRRAKCQSELASLSFRECKARVNRKKKYFEDAIAQARVDLERARSTRPVSLRINGGEARADGTVPVPSLFELRTATLQGEVTAIRVQVHPIDASSARHTPEDGFIVDRLNAFIVDAAGHEREIAIRHFFPDSDDRLQSVLRAQRDTFDLDSFSQASLFAANPKLFQSRWLIAIPAEPLKLGPGDRIKVQVLHTQAIAFKPAPVRRFAIEVTPDARWTVVSGDEKLREKLAELGEIEKHLNKIASVQLPVMSEQPPHQRRQTLQFERGNFLVKSGPVLSPDVPSLFPGLPSGAPRDRLAMARWFFNPQQPLTARVAANRYWEQMFGAGLVETLEDFGSAGQSPTHPELLDWLAVHFQRDLQWDTKALLRELATSSTYRQSAAGSRAALERDPRNRLLARGPQQRLTAEMVRDQALMASGLLSPTIGGPPVMPPQPPGVWTGYNDFKWTDATGSDRYRRAIYTYLKRSAIYPSTAIFDAPDHVVSVARRIPTNTPLQALVTLNDPVYYEAAEALARRMLDVERGASSEERLASRLNFASRCVLSRDLWPTELGALRALHRYVLGTTRVDAKKREVAALTAVAAALLNVDAALTR